MINNKMKSLHLIPAIATGIVLLNLNCQSRAIADSSEQFCFLITASGKVIDLSNSFCHSQQSKLISTNSDKAFIEEYKNRAIKYSDIRDNLISNIESYPQVKIEQAKNVCTDLKAGIDPNEIADNLNKDLTRASRVNALIINFLAVKIYCPDVFL